VKKPSEWLAEQGVELTREQAKSVDFGVNYGGGPMSIPAQADRVRELRDFVASIANGGLVVGGQMVGVWSRSEMMERARALVPHYEEDE
jgi:hypothetical protein